MATKMAFVVFVFGALLAIAISAPVDSKDAKILSYENEIVGDNGYKFAYRTDDGTTREEQGELKNIGAENEALSVRGSYSYSGTDGAVYSVNYVADENGFQPTMVKKPKTAGPKKTNPRLRLSPAVLASLVG